MPHNGGIFQTGFNFLQIGGAYPFINFVKAAQTFEIAGVGLADPSNVTPNGYPINTTGAQEAGGLFYTPVGNALTGRPGNYVCKWIGGGPTTEIVSSWLGTIIEGSKFGANGRFVVQFNPGTEPYNIGRVLMRYKNLSPNPAITHLAFMHEDDEDLYDAGEVWSPIFKQKIIDSNFGLLRNLDWGSFNVSNLSAWEYRTPVDYVSYAGEVLFHDLWAGEAIRTGTAYAVAKSGFTLTHGKQVHVRWGTAGTVATDGNGDSVFVDTLNVNGTGDVPIVNHASEPYTHSTGLMQVGYYSTLFYDADLHVWIKFGGASGVGNKLIIPHVPFELYVRLCKEVGAHPWFVQPFLSSDPPSNLMTELALYVDGYIANPANNAGWMIPHYELVWNENWNTAGSFYGTRYGWSKIKDRYGVNTDTHNAHGRAFSLNAQAIWTALGVSAKTPSRFKLICGVQTYGSSSASNPRLTSALYVAENPGVNRPAKDYCDAVAPATYYGADGTAANQTQELILAMNYAAASTDAERNAIAVQFLELFTGNIETLKARWVDWRNWALSHGVNEMLPYEGGYSTDYKLSNVSGTISGITRGATTTIHTTGRLPIQDMSVVPNDVVGTTGLNDNTYQVLSVGVGSYVINADSSAMGDWISNGDTTVTYLDTKIPINILYDAARKQNELKPITRQHVENFFRCGGRYFSKFMFAGDSGPNTPQQQIWAGFFPDIYGSNCKEMDLYQELGNDPNPINFLIRM
jgi:hypothetical protein